MTKNTDTDISHIFFKFYFYYIACWSHNICKYMVTKPTLKRPLEKLRPFQKQSQGIPRSIFPDFPNDCCSNVGLYFLNFIKHWGFSSSFIFL